MGPPRRGDAVNRDSRARWIDSNAPDQTLALGIANPAHQFGRPSWRQAIHRELSILRSLALATEFRPANGDPCLVRVVPTDAVTARFEQAREHSHAALRPDEAQSAALPLFASRSERRAGGLDQRCVSASGLLRPPPAALRSHPSGHHGTPRRCAFTASRAFRGVFQRRFAVEISLSLPHPERFVFPLGLSMTSAARSLALAFSASPWRA